MLIVSISLPTDPRGRGSRGGEFFGAGVRGDGLAGHIEDAREAAVALGTVFGGADAFGLPGDGGAAVHAEAGVVGERGRVWAGGFGCEQAAAADGADAPGAQAVGEQRRQRVAAGGTALDLTAVEMIKLGVAFWAIGLGR